jgi:dolichyl-phosphate-mannose--protein O-mannosyl transferase
LGKWLIGLGIRIFGFSPFGVRIASAVAGILTIALLYLLARKLLRSTTGAILASSLLAVDFLHFVTSRVAMLDGFVTMFGTAAFLFLLYDRGTSSRPGPAPNTIAARLSQRRWRLAAGLMGGAAAACKWSGLFVLVALPVLTAVWERSRIRARGEASSLRRALREQGPSMAVAYAALPAAVYVSSYAGRIHGAVLAAPWSHGSWARSFANIQVHGMFAYHVNAHAVHPYMSDPWSWPLLKRPVMFFFSLDHGIHREVLATGNPLVWWPSVFAIAYVAVRWFRQREADGPEGVILAGFAFSYAPWLLLALHRSPVFSYYLLPAVPFMCLAVAYALTRLDRSPRRVATALFAAMVIASFAFFYPVLAAVPLGHRSWQDRMLFRDCEAIRGAQLLANAPDSIVGPDPRERRWLHPVSTGPPPQGWCWI